MTEAVGYVGEICKLMSEVYRMLPHQQLLEGDQEIVELPQEI